MRENLNVSNCRLIRLQKIEDPPDGTISIAQVDHQIPFEIKRVYYIYDLNNPTAVRGKHAHKKLEQVLFCIKGSCTVGLDDGIDEQTVLLDEPNTGIYLGAELWHTMERFSDDCILLVLASDVYNEDDYLRNYQDFKAYIAKSDHRK